MPPVTALLKFRMLRVGHIRFECLQAADRLLEFSLSISMSLRSFFIFISVVIPTCLCAQHSVGPSIGGTLSGLRYITSSGQRLSNLKGAPGFIAAIGYQHESSGKSKTARTCFSADLGYQTINFRDSESHIATTWALRYTFAAVGFRLVNSKNKRVHPYAGASVAVGFLSGGSQQRGFEQYNITDNLRPINFSAGVDGGIFYNISDEAYCLFSIGYQRGLSNIEKDPQQRATVNAARVAMAVYFRLSKK
jgi:hypothetical protein